MFWLLNVLIYIWKSPNIRRLDYQCTYKIAKTIDTLILLYGLVFNHLKGGTCLFIDEETLSPQSVGAGRREKRELSLSLLT